MRDLSLIGLMVVVAIGLGTFLFFLGPSTLRSDVDTAFGSNSSATASKSVPITVLAQGQNAASITDRANYRIQNTHDLAALWELVYGYNDTPAAPAVNFSTNEVLAVFDGTDPTTDYTINIVSVTDENSTRLVLVSHEAPASSCTVKNTSTSPFEIIEVPKTTNTLSHQDQMGTTTAC